MPRQVLDNLLPGKAGISKAAVSTNSNKSARNPPPLKHCDAKESSSNCANRSEILPSLHAKPFKTRASETISKIMLIISEEAGVDPVDLQPNSEFSEYGIDSLLSLTIIGRLQEELGLSLEQTLFADYPTVKELNEFLVGDDLLRSSASSSEGKQILTPEPDTSWDAMTSDYETGSTSLTEPDQVLDVIRSMVAEETGVSIGDVTSSVAFSELGIDSLLSLTIMGRLSEVLGVEIPFNLFSDNNTLKDVEKVLCLKQNSTSNNGDIVTSNGENDSFIPTAPPLATSVLLQGNAKTATRCLFLFPDGSGSATSYASLPKISKNVVVYGLNCPWMKTPCDMTCSLEQLVSKYLIEIRRRRPKGPYNLGGWSAGGICAYEAAQQLIDSGEKVARLVLLDSPNPIDLENPPQRMYDFFDSMNFFGTNGKAPPDWLRPHFNAFLTLLDNYKVKPFKGPPLQTHIIYAKDGICKNPSDPRPETRPDDPREMIWLLNNRSDFSAKGWVELLGSQNLKVHVLDDVNHFSMVAPGPKIKVLSEYINLALK